MCVKIFLDIFYLVSAHLSALERCALISWCLLKKTTCLLIIFVCKKINEMCAHLTNPIPKATY